MKPQELFKTIGENIQRLRKEKGIKGETLGKEMGVTKVAISHFEHGSVDFKISTLQKIANVLNTDISRLLELESSANTKEIELIDCRDQINKQLRVINILVCRIEYLNEQIECMKKKKSRQQADLYTSSSKKGSDNNR